MTNVGRLKERRMRIERTLEAGVKEVILGVHEALVEATPARIGRARQSWRIEGKLGEVRRGETVRVSNDLATLVRLDRGSSKRPPLGLLATGLAAGRRLVRGLKVLR